MTTFKPDIHHYCEYGYMAMIYPKLSKSAINSSNSSSNNNINCNKIATAHCISTKLFLHMHRSYNMVFEGPPQYQKYEARDMRYGNYIHMTHKRISKAFQLDFIVFCVSFFVVVVIQLLCGSVTSGI